MEEISFTGLLIVTAVAFAAPLVLGAAPWLRFPSVVLEIVAGILIGPSVLGWVDPDPAIEVIAVVGLAFLLFLAGLEIDLSRLRGLILRNAALGFGLSIVLALGAGLALDAAGLAGAPLLGRDHPRLDVARNRGSGPEGRGRDPPRASASS